MSKLSLTIINHHAVSVIHEPTILSHHKGPYQPPATHGRPPVPFLRFSSYRFSSRRALREVQHLPAAAAVCVVQALLNGGLQLLEFVVLGPGP